MSKFVEIEATITKGKFIKGTVYKVGHQLADELIKAGKAQIKGAKVEEKKTVRKKNS